MPSMQNHMMGGHHSDGEEFNSDDENVPLTQDIYGGSMRSIQETKAWDVFRVLPPEAGSTSTANQRFMAFTIKILKIFVYLFTFIIVLASGVITKGTTLFMTSHIKPRKMAYCNHDIGRDKDWEVELSNAERVAWMWCIFIAFAIPEFGTWFRSTRMCVFKSWTKPKILDFVIVFIFETAYTIGVALLFYVVLPDLDVVKGAMLTNCVCFVPGVFGLLSRGRKEDKRTLKWIVDSVAILAQASGFVAWPLVQQGPYSWTIPVAIFLVSCGWWENYVDEQSPVGFVKALGKIKENLKRTRYFVYLFISIWKMFLFLVSFFVLVYFVNGDSLHDIFRLIKPGFGIHPLNVTEVEVASITGNAVPDLSTVAPFHVVEHINSSRLTPFYVLMIQTLCAWICYIFAKFACKICIQGFSFAFPVNLTIPVTISLLIAACGLRNDNSCIFQHFIPSYLYWQCPHGDFLNDFISNEYAWVWLLWLLSQTWITLHVWSPKCERLATTEKLFVTPMYSALLIDQSLGMNRRRDDDPDVKTEVLDLDRDGPDEPSQYYETISLPSESSHTHGSGGKGTKSSDHITRIYACATMWHETQEEMLEMLKSIFRMDEDQSARRVAQKYLRIVDPDYYEFETHIFFDDSYEISDDNEDENVVNRFVKDFVSVMDEAASHVHEINIRLRPPKKVPTPYGGRLVYTLPGKTKILVHLKDKSKIRHKKRWSQVMYMYYLLGHRLMELPISVERKETLAGNTYLLTLDGDIDFQAGAVQLLVDLMKKNRNLGAACGRIHPVGSGPMVWYQMFEYAIGHWLQKATEHMIGCVLCSPGCFSLFRGKALMDDNVMRRYTTKSAEARHYVQYDQGEDRWLCTLLLQRGYRVEYSAASDAYTRCPEGFSEFYNQRRRWVPSTMANIMDLLMDYKKTIKINDNISLPYICYQTMLMAGTILGPGTIFLMLVGAFVAAFRIDNFTSFYYNIIPILLFFIICFICKSNIQLLIAQVMSAGYALVMMAVIVGTTLQMREDGMGSPSFIFFSMLTGSFLIAALMHPQEFKCILPGLLYLLSIPSMYLLLIIYSLINLNVVSWGTRETPTKKTKKELEQERKEAEEAMKKKRKQPAWMGLLGQTGDDRKGSIEFSLAGLCKIMLCTHDKPDEGEQLARIADNLDTITKRLDHLEKGSDHLHSSTSSLLRRKSIPRTHFRGGEALSAVNENSTENDDMDDEGDDDSDSERNEPHQKRDDLINPYWIEDKDLRRGEVDYLAGQEVGFWKDLIEKYLAPIEQNKEHQAKVAADLKELRTRSVFFFFMTNALFVLIVFLLQLHKDNLHMDWPFGVKTNITYVEETSEVHIQKEYLQLEPIGLVFVFFFALILVIQFVAMLFHRFGTFSHILASTDLKFCDRKVEDMSEDAFIDKHAVEIVKGLQKLKGADEDSDAPDIRNIGTRQTIHALEKSRQKKRITGTLDVAFRKRFMSIGAQEEGINQMSMFQGTPVLSGLNRHLSLTRETMKALEQRRNTVMAERQEKKKMETLGAKNELNPNRLRHRPSSVNGGAEGLRKVFTPNGIHNEGYYNDSDEDNQSTRLKNINRAQVSWQDDKHNGGLPPV